MDENTEGVGALIPAAIDWIVSFRNDTLINNLP
jgi:hypothetical protein